jgi:hypothetical protein
LESTVCRDPAGDGLTGTSVVNDERAPHRKADSGAMIVS